MNNLKMLLGALLLPMLGFSQYDPARLELNYSGRHSFNDKIDVVSPVDTFALSRVGQGKNNAINATFFFNQVYPDFRIGLSGFYEKAEEGRFLLNPEDYNYYDYRILEAKRGGMSLVFAFDELIEGAELHFGAGLAYEKSELQWLYRNVGDLRNSSQERLLSRLGFNLNPRVIYSRDEGETFLPKADLQGGGTIWFRPDLDGQRLSYNVNLSINLVRILDLGSFYVSPVIGGSINENSLVSIGTSPFVSGGLAISSSFVRADLFKIIYQRRIYHQKVIPYSGIDGIFFSINIGAFWQ